MLNPGNASAHQDVWFDADGRLRVANGFEAELTGIIGEGIDLQAELDAAAEWIGPNVPPLLLKSKVRGRIASRAQERKDRDRRYHAAVKAKASQNDAAARKQATLRQLEIIAGRSFGDLG